MGKSWFEEAILDEIVELLRIFRGYSGTAFNPAAHLTVAVSNVICALTFGQRFEHSDERFVRLVSQNGQNMLYTAVLQPAQFFPFLKQIPFGKFHDAWDGFMGNMDRVISFIRDLVAEHKVRFNSGGDGSGENRDYVDRYLAEAAKLESKGQSSTFAGKFDRM